MQYDQTLIPEQRTIRLRGTFTFTDHTTFRSVIEDIGRGQESLVVFDCAALEYIDSAGLGMLLLAKSRAEQRRASVTLANPQGQVAKVFSLSRFDSVFAVTPSAS